MSQRIATSTPQTFLVASRATAIRNPRSSGHPTGGRAHRTRPISTRLDSETELGRNDASSSRTPLHHAYRTRTIWQY